MQVLQLAPAGRDVVVEEVEQEVERNAGATRARSHPGDLRGAVVDLLRVPDLLHAAALDHVFVQRPRGRGDDVLERRRRGRRGGRRDEEGWHHLGCVGVAGGDDEARGRGAAAAGDGGNELAAEGGAGRQVEK